MAVKFSISLTDEQHRFAKELVEAGRYSSVSAVRQQGIDLLRQRMHNDDLERAALKALLDQRSVGALVSGGQMDKTIARVAAASGHALRRRWIIARTASATSARAPTNWEWRPIAGRVKTICC